jgi:hypothetical protein
MKTARSFPSFFLALALLGACSDDPPPPVEPEPAAPEQPAAPAPANVEPSEQEVPIVEDFEEEAAREIKADDLNAQLDAMEQEIEMDSR